VLRLLPISYLFYKQTLKSNLGHILKSGQTNGNFSTLAAILQPWSRQTVLQPVTI